MVTYLIEADDLGEMRRRIVRRDGTKISDRDPATLHR
jgi:hypothetical protein